MGSGKESYIHGTGHMTKRAVMLIYLKIFKNRLLQMFMKLGMEQYELKIYKVYINDDPELTHFKTMLNFGKLFFVLTVALDIR